MQKAILYNKNIVTLIDGTVLDINDLYQYYITENHSKKEAMVKFNIRAGAFTKVVGHYNIKKPRQLSNVHNKKTCLALYGDATYNNQEQLKKTNLERYGCENVFQSDKIKNKLCDTKIKRYGNSKYVNPEKAKQTCLEKYGVDSANKLESTKQKRKQTFLERYGVEYPMQSDEIKAKYDFKAVAEKGFATKKLHGTTNTSAIQQKVVETLKAKYGADNVLTEYKESRYPYHCDAYIKSLDLFIELNLYFTHGGHPFSNNKKDRELLKIWEEKAKTSKFYYNAIVVWTVTDPAKQKCAQINKLNYKMFYTYQEVEEFLKELNA